MMNNWCKNLCPSNSAWSQLRLFLPQGGSWQSLHPWLSVLCRGQADFVNWGGRRRRCLLWTALVWHWQPSYSHGHSSLKRAQAALPASSAAGVSCRVFVLPASLQAVGGHCPWLQDWRHQEFQNKLFNYLPESSKFWLRRTSTIYATLFIPKAKMFPTQNAFLISLELWVPAYQPQKRQLISNLQPEVGEIRPPGRLWAKWESLLSARILLIFNFMPLDLFIRF